MFNPEMAKQMMTPERIKQMSQMFSGMSDDQIRSYCQMAGMGNMDPKFMRQQMQMMSGMRNEDIQAGVNQVTPENIENAKRFMNNSQPQQPNPAASPQPKDDPYPIITKLKNLGNDAFKRGDYNTAASKYWEAISEIEEIWENNKFIKSNAQKSKELQVVETACRMNYCNVKAKQGQFDIVRKQAQVVIDFDPSNGKANYRMAQALFELGQPKEAHSYVLSAIKELPNDAPIQELLKQIELKVTFNDDVQPQKQKGDQENLTQRIPQSAEPQAAKNENPEMQEPREERANDAKDAREVKPQSKENSHEAEQTKMEMQQRRAPDPSEPKVINRESEWVDEKAKKPKIKLESVDTSSKEFQDLKQKVAGNTKVEDGQIEEEPVQPTERQSTTPPQTSTPMTNGSQAFTNMQPRQNATQAQLNFSDPQVKQGFEQFKNMSPSDMQMLSSMFQNMDNNMIKSMMKAQTGMEMTDFQIEQMKRQMTPEMLQTVKSMDPAVLQQQRMQFQPPTQQMPQTQQTSSQQQASEAPQASDQNQQLPQQPNFNNLAQNPQMLNMVIDQIKANPEMLRAMAPMMGENAVSNFILNSSPSQLSRLVKWMALALKGCMGAYRVWIFTKSQWKFVLGFVIAYIMFKLL